MIRNSLLVLPCLLFAALGAEAAPTGKIVYNRDIRPILTENCFACHGPDSAARKADLRLDNRDAAIEMGAIIPGKVDESSFIKRILLPDSDKGLMPPLKTHKSLKPAQKELLKQWVAQGAEYQPHWSFIASTRPALPKVQKSGWVRNPIDAFVLADLEKRGLSPAPEADRRTLARRVSLDLTGLPPDPADVDEFVRDLAPDAYEKYVDKILRSVHWGEHRGRYWLDAARYADTHGIHFDNYREMWAYRDWVINAFNQNMPFDQFTIEQLAGDLLPNPTLDQKIATGFNRCNITTNEGGVIAEEYAVFYTRDRTETVNSVWMGLTAGCAVCHDHKFDPLSMKEFYSMAAFFNNTTQNVMDGNIKDTPPIITVPLAADRPKLDELEQKLTAVRANLTARKKAARVDFDKWVKESKPTEVATLPTDKLQFHARLTEGEGKKILCSVEGKERPVTLKDGFAWTDGKYAAKSFLVQQGDTATFADVGDFDTKDAFTVSTWVRITKRGTTGAIVARMDGPTKGHRGWDLWLEADKVGMHIINKYPEDALKCVSKTPLKPGQWYHVCVSYDGSAKQEGLKIYVDGELQAHDVQNNSLKGTTKTTVPFKIGQRNGEQRVQNVAIEDLRVYQRSLPLADVSKLAKTPHVAELLSKPADKRTDKETEQLFSYYLASVDKPYLSLSAEESKVVKEEAEIRARGTITHISVEKMSTPEAFVLFRGAYDQRRDKVTPNTPKNLPPFPKELPRNRLGFAKWLLLKEHPLTARVTVNRFWQEMFGTGLVRTSGDFGITGELPSNPELLDWLAEEFKSHWDIKRFFKMVVTSATYRQSAQVDKNKLEVDPDNRHMSRGPRFRMDAEMVRDYALAASGLMVRKIGGPSVKPYQPEGVWEAVAMIGSNTRDYKRDTGDKLYRRSMYTFWKRSAPPASMEILNAPSRENCTVRRERTNTPLQALVTLNDVQFVESARVLAEAALKSESTDEKRLDFVTRRLLSRTFLDKERQIVEESLQTLRKEFAAKTDEAKKLVAFGESKADPKLDVGELATWTMLCNEILNLDEVLNK